MTPGRDSGGSTGEDGAADLSTTLDALRDDLADLRDEHGEHGEDESATPNPASGHRGATTVVLDADDAGVLREHGVALRTREGRQHRTEQYAVVHLRDASTGDRLDRERQRDVFAAVERDRRERDPPEVERHRPDDLDRNGDNLDGLDREQDHAGQRGGGERPPGHAVEDDDPEREDERQESSVGSVPLSARGGPGAIARRYAERERRHGRRSPGER